MAALRETVQRPGAPPDASLRLVPLRREETRLRSQPSGQLPPAKRRLHVATELAGRHQSPGYRQLLWPDGELSLLPERHVQEQLSVPAE